MSQALYQDDAYLRSCRADVLVVGDDHFVLDKTVFYPVGGGQPGDTGQCEFSQGSLTIADTQYLSSGQIAHFVEEPLPIKAGEVVTLSLDWERRYLHMRMHTCLHLLGSVLNYPVTGGNISATKSRLDFDMTEPVDKPAVEQALNDLIDADHPVRTQWITEQELDAQPELIRTMSVKPPKGRGRVRLLEIPGIDLQPCGGTHVRTTGEIGRVRLAKVEKKGRQNRRINVVFAD